MSAQPEPPYLHKGSGLTFPNMALLGGMKKKLPEKGGWKEQGLNLKRRD